MPVTHNSLHWMHRAPAVFIRAPAVMEAGADVEVLAKYTLTAEEAAAASRADVAVAVRRGVLLATAFHPELTKDVRWCVLLRLDAGLGLHVTLCGEPWAWKGCWRV